MISVGVAVPVRNGARWLEAALASASAPGPVRLHLLVRDALSVDATPDILTGSGFTGGPEGRLAPDRGDGITRRWIRRNDRGQADAVAEGLIDLVAAGADWVTWLNADDLWLPGTAEAVAAATSADPGADVIYGDAIEIDAQGQIIGPQGFTEHPDAERYLTSHNFICQPTAFIHRRVLERLGPPRADRTWFFDYEWFGRMFLAGCRFRRLEVFLAANRDHPSTKTNTGLDRRFAELIRVLAGRPGFPWRQRRAWRIYWTEWRIQRLRRDLAQGRDRLRARLEKLCQEFLQSVQPRESEAIARRFQVARPELDRWLDGLKSKTQRQT